MIYGKKGNPIFDQKMMFRNQMNREANSPGSPKSEQASDRDEFVVGKEAPSCTVSGTC